MQNLGNIRSVQKCAQNAGSNVLKLGYKIRDPSEGHMHYDVIDMGWNDVLTAWIYRKSIRNFKDFDFLKRIQKFKTNQIILEKDVYISRKEISSNLSLLLLESYNKKD